jgi:hypothetical protein
MDEENANSKGTAPVELMGVTPAPGAKKAIPLIDPRRTLSLLKN